WSSHNPTGNNLNAVAFSFGENLFLAVGDSGVVFTSPDGVNWSLATTLPNALRGVTFANKGNFQGVGLLVGDNGSIVLAGTIPNPPGAVDSNPTYCDGSSPLVPQVTNYLTAANPLQTIDWFAAPSGGSPIVPNGRGTNTFIPPSPATNPPPTTA